MPFLELYHIYIYYMTSHVQFGCKILPTTIVMSLTNASRSTLSKCPVLHAILSYIFKSESMSIWIISSMPNCSYICLKEARKVSGCDSIA